jgi:hypothetical protein
MAWYSGAGRRHLMAGSDGTPNRGMDCRGAEKGNLARKLGAHHYIDRRAENTTPTPVLLTAATSFVLLVNSAGYKQFSDNADFRRWLTDMVFSRTYENAAAGRATNI